MFESECLVCVCPGECEKRTEAGKAKALASNGAVIGADLDIFKL